ncbi:hypothetical protein GF391_03770 [Candidatus Uhrbacteria bacterium]|nr:hypothetical protein [Candidatus Uhrbacteria bacterium]
MKGESEMLDFVTAVARRVARIAPQMGVERIVFLHKESLSQMAFCEDKVRYACRDMCQSINQDVELANIGRSGLDKGVYDFLLRLLFVSLDTDLETLRADKDKQKILVCSFSAYLSALCGMNIVHYSAWLQAQKLVEEAAEAFKEIGEQVSNHALAADWGALMHDPNRFAQVHEAMMSVEPEKRRNFLSTVAYGVWKMDKMPSRDELADLLTASRLGLSSLN